MDPEKLRMRAQSGVSWFYWIAGLSVVNSIIAATGSTWGFMAGLGVTQMIDGVALAIGPASKVIALGLNVVIAALVVGLGIWASRSSKVYVCGMILYALDGGIFLLVQDWVGLGFHGLVLFFLWGGYTARRTLDRQVSASSLETSIDKAA
jgi:hypothetical protein